MKLQKWSDLVVDDSEQSFSKILEEVNSNIENIVSEEDSKIQIINRLLTEVLGWPHSSISAENHHENGFSDYIIKESDSNAFLIEAKRIGKLSINTAERNKVRYLKLSGSSLTNCQEGVDQAVGYCTPNGIPLAVLTDGIQWIVFKTFVLGASFKLKEAIVFPSLESIKNHFSVFYELLSRESVNKRLYNSIFDEIHNNRVNLVQEFYAPVEPSDIRINKKSDLAYDLDKVFERYLSAMAGKDDEDLIVECFVESRESRIADFSLEKMTTSVLGNITANKDVNDQLTSLIELSVATEDKTDSGQTVFIVGPTGAGKTTFLERFFKKTLTRAIKEQCVIVNVNCLDSTGNEETIIDWLTEQLISKIEQTIYHDGSPDWNQLRALYQGEYLRRAKGTGEKLYKKDKEEFQIQFSNYLEELVEKDRETYLKRLLKDIVTNRKMLPIIVIDNTDENSIEFKQKIFQFFQSLRREVKHALLIFPVTDKSAWSFSKTDIFGIYDSRSFFLPTPSPRDVFRKRVEYIKDKIQLVKTKEEKKRYFAEKGMGISIENLSGFTEVLESIFVDHDFTSKTIGQLTNYNIRRTLKLSQRVLTSSVLKIEDLVRSYVSGKPVITKYPKFIDALLKGNHKLFKKGDTPELIPIFDVDAKVRQSPLQSLRILALLKTVMQNGKSIEEQHLGVNSIVSYFDSIGGNETSIEKSLLTLLESGLIEPYDTSSSHLSPAQKVAITHKGKSHLNLAAKNSVFFYQMALTTFLLDCDLALEIKDILDNTEDFKKRVSVIKSKFASYLVKEDAKFFNHQLQNEQYSCQFDLIQEIKHFENLEKTPENDLTLTLGDNFAAGLSKKGVLATVDWYDPKKRYGFATVADLEEGAFIHLDNLLEWGIAYITEGDGILCDISRNEKGIQIDKIYDVEVDSESIEKAECKIERLYKERNYGFAKTVETNLLVYFHTYTFSEEQRKNLYEGDSFEAEIVLDNLSGTYQVRRIT